MRHPQPQPAVRSRRPGRDGRYRLPAGILVVLALLAALPSVASAEMTFVARLSGAQVSPPVTTNGSGLGVFRLSTDQKSLSYDLVVQDLTNVTVAHLHIAPPGESGPVAIPLASAPFNRLSGTAAITPEQVSALLAGNVYVNVHTAANPNGEIRGQLRANPPRTFVAELTGDQVATPVTTQGTGLGVFTLDATRSLLIYELVVAGLQDVTVAHLHRGEPGQDGPVVVPLASAPFTHLTGTAPLTEAIAADLEAGRLYANVHTAAHPGGEIRGQVLARTPTTFVARALGLNQVPPTTSTGFGLGVFHYDAATRKLSYRVVVDGLQGITEAHLHTGEPDASGPVCVPLADAPFTQLSGTADLSEEQVGCLLAGRLYLNVHTAANPAGEIRGHLFSRPATTLVARLSGDQETPPVTTQAGGVALMTLDSTRSLLSYDLEIADIQDVTAAHFHRGAVGAPGPVVIPVASGPFARQQGLVDLPRDLANDLLLGNLYLNVHTAAHTGGEIRGQAVGRLAGDANDAFGVDIGDVIIALRIAVRLTEPTADQVAILDVAPRGARDGVVNISDVLVLLQRAVGLVAGPL